MMIAFLAMVMFGEAVLSPLLAAEGGDASPNRSLIKEIVVHDVRVWHKILSILNNLWLKKLSMIIDVQGAGLV